MGVYRNKRDGLLEIIAGGTLYADNPIGTILAFGGSSIPTGWHLCDGTAVSRTTYKDLFNAIGTNFGVGDGSTTFNLPDLSGEFLRGAGTNSHSGQGNGANVGVHQDATRFDNFCMNRNDGNFVAGYHKGSYDKYPANLKGQNNADSYQGNSVDGAYNTSIANNWQYDSSWQNEEYFTARPTNTSVNYIIKMFKTAVPVEVKGDGGNNYSTEERVIGTWIDGKPLYRKVFYNGGNAIPNNIDVTSLHIDDLINDWANGRKTGYKFTYAHTGGDRYILLSNNILSYTILGGETTYWLAIEYTKTTD